MPRALRRPESRSVLLGNSGHVDRRALSGPQSNAHVLNSDEDHDHLRQADSLRSAARLRRDSLLAARCMESGHDSWRVGVVVPARNEAGELDRTLHRSALQQMEQFGSTGSATHIIVVADSSSMAPASIARDSPRQRRQGLMSVEGCAVRGGTVHGRRGLRREVRAAAYVAAADSLLPLATQRGAPACERAPGTRPPDQITPMAQHDHKQPPPTSRVRDKFARLGCSKLAGPQVV